MLALEIEHLLGVAFAAQGQDRAEPDWPPQPDRVFSALVAAWGARGERAEEREALEWLEELAPPDVAASQAHARPAPTTFVPPNDPAKEEAVPARRRRQPRRFPAALPEDRCIHLVWPEADAPPPTLDALNALARDTAYVGHSASLTRCWFRADNPSAHPLRPARRRVYRGRLVELEQAFKAERRPSPGSPVRRAPRPASAGPKGPFSADWLLFEFDAWSDKDRTEAWETKALLARDGADLRAAPLLARTLRLALMSGYQAIGRGDAIPPAISGHAPDGSPTTAAHMAVAPLANVGFDHSTGDLFGLAILPPREEAEVFDHPDFHQAVVRQLQGGALVLKVGMAPAETGAPTGAAFRLRPLDHGGRASLDPRRYARRARTWATVTPMVLDRHLKALPRRAPGAAADRQAELEELIARACLNLGLEPARTDDGRWGVEAHKHSAIAGAPSAQPSGHAPSHTRWHVPEHQRSRPLVHAVIRFSEPVEGPLVLGAGRFVGLGLCLPLDAEEEG